MKFFVILLLALTLCACKSPPRAEKLTSVTCYNGTEVVIDTVAKGTVWVSAGATEFSELGTGKWIKTTFPCVSTPIN